LSGPPVQFIRFLSKAMFKTRWYNRGKVLSDEGFSIELGQDWLVYRRGQRRMTITVDVGGSEINIFVGTANRWDDSPSTEVDEGTKWEIISDIKRGLEWKGLSVRLVP
jgi:hypothetical protein